MRVLLLFEYSTQNGGENSALSVLPHVLAAGVSVIGAAPKGPFADRLGEYVDVVTFDLQHADGSQSRKREMIDVVCRSVQPDIVHGNSLSVSRLVGPMSATTGATCLGHLRDIVKLSKTAIADLNCNDRLLAVSEATRAFHVQQGLIPSKAFVQYNGVDVRQFRPSTADGWLHHELGISKQARLIGGVGQLGPRKGWDVLVAAMKRVTMARPEAHLVIVGERNSAKKEAIDYEQDLLDAANLPPLVGRVHFLGRRSKMHRLLPEFTCLVHPARQEPLGRVLLEASACGLPIIATAVGGTEEVFPADDGAALLVPPDNVDAVTTQILRVLESKTLRGTLGQNARRRSLATFDEISAAGRLVEHYRDTNVAN